MLYFNGVWILSDACIKNILVQLQNMHTFIHRLTNNHRWAKKSFSIILIAMNCLLCMESLEFLYGNRHSKNRNYYFIVQVFFYLSTFLIIEAVNEFDVERKVLLALSEAQTLSIWKYSQFRKFLAYEIPFVHFFWKFGNIFFMD